MGLLDTLFGGAPADPNQMLGQFTDPRLQIAAGLLSGHGNLGANLSTGLLGAATQAQAQRNFAMTQQATERANRANDLQQLQGLFGMALKQDTMRRMQEEDAGNYQHVPDPALEQIQRKMSELAGFPLASSGRVSQPNSSGPAQPSPSAMPQPGPAQPAMPVSSVGQNFRGANPDYQPMPQPTGQPPQYQQLPQPQGGQPQYQQLPQPGNPPGMDPFARSRRQGDMYALMGMPEIAQNRYKMGSPIASHGLSIDPATGQLIGGVIGNVPMQRAPDGSLRVVPNDINAQLAARAGLTTAAEQAQRYENVPIGNNQTQLMTLGDYARRQALGLSPPSLPPSALPQPPGTAFPQTAPSGQPALTVPPDLQAYRDATRASMVRSELPGEPNPAVRAALNTELGAMPGSGFVASGQNLGQGGLGITPNPSIQAANVEEGKVRGQVLGDYGKTVQAAADTAPELKARLADVKQLTQTVQPGVLAPYKLAFGAYLRGFGIPEKTVTGITGNVGDMQNLIKQSLTMAFAQTRSLGTREAAQVIDMSLKANPGLTMTPEGINRIVDFMDGVENWKLARNDAALQWQNSPNNPNKSLEGFQQYWDRTNPVMKFVPSLQQMTAPLNAQSSGAVAPRRVVHFSELP